MRESRRCPATSGAFSNTTPIDPTEAAFDGVKLVSSNAYEGLKKPIGTVFQGAGRQRCRVHCILTVQAVVPNGSREVVASIIRTACAQPGRGNVEKRFRAVATVLGRSHPTVAAMLVDATRPARLRRVPAAAPAPNLVHAPPQAGERGNRTTHRCRRSVPRCRAPVEAGGVGVDRSARRGGKRPTTLLLRSIHARSGRHEQPHRGLQRGRDPPRTRRCLDENF